MCHPKHRPFWQEAFALSGSVTPHVMPNVLTFGLVASVTTSLVLIAEHFWGIHLRLELIPFEIAGAALGLLLVFRTNAGYERWWEARKLWGGIVNQSRNVAISGLAYGPDDQQWRKEFVAWAASFCHVAKSSLRLEDPSEEVRELVGNDSYQKLLNSEHRPAYVAYRLARLLQSGTEKKELDQFSFLQIDKERALLIDHIGACERILNTPIPLAYSIKIRRFLTLFLLTLPLPLMHRVGTEWFVPFVTMLASYPLLSLDLIGAELQNPFSKGNMGHLPLDEISGKIEGNLKGLLKNGSCKEETVDSQLEETKVISN